MNLLLFGACFEVFSVILDAQLWILVNLRGLSQILLDVVGVVPGQGLVPLPPVE